MSIFQLDSRLENDTYMVATGELSHLLLMNDARFPWFILVPAQPDLSEVIDLSQEQSAILMHEIRQVSQTLKTLFNPDKLNVAALGNHVRQLHVHVLARFVSDEAWPNPVWGRGERVPYPPHRAGALIDKFVAQLKLTSPLWIYDAS
jgi:diadenosine tetraphosphate (Ap4A) HIT family hydrolase